LFCFLFAFVASVIIGPFIIKTIQKLRAGQNILEYVENHKSKQGTPTMCGLIFIIGTSLASIFAFNQSYTLALMTIITMLGFGLLGFLDDFIKVKSHQNEGLKPYQKIIGQLGISIIIAIFVYNFVGTEIIIPFAHTSVDIGGFIIPLVIITMLSLVNAVNLLDGLDGLASGVSIFYLLSFLGIITIGLPLLSGTELIEQQNLITVCFCLVGALTAFEIFNGFPAKVFMGDTGSLFLGGMLVAIAYGINCPLILLPAGLVFVLEGASDVLQIVYYRISGGKRIFKMAPIHHHFEMCGWSEKKIVSVFGAVNILGGAAAVALMKFGGYFG
jgi:phospho-N-acetylmuramoyl-pentapeptide-transferase